MALLLPFLEAITLSAVLGGLVGWQRERSGKAAGLRTYALVCIGSTVFTFLSIYGFSGTTIDQTRIAAQIITGIGFIGAGSIIHKESSVEGLTTASGLWAIAAVGMLVGTGWYAESIITTIIIMMILVLNKKFFRL
jgi:putative Mg2+ transporter-C (MgtC) family protein